MHIPFPNLFPPSLTLIGSIRLSLGKPIKGLGHPSRPVFVSTWEAKGRRRGGLDGRMAGGSLAANPLHCAKVVAVESLSGVARDARSHLGLALGEDLVAFDSRSRPSAMLVSFFSTQSSCSMDESDASFGCKGTRATEAEAAREVARQRLAVTAFQILWEKAGCANICRVIFLIRNAVFVVTFLSRGLRGLDNLTGVTTCRWFL
ncbi:hypothetical protein N7532_005374 [Penicillium argentinense]|uniref:Uncharacterized protein n=1 Tax=Penicillium argentinense TaxID=1131581 RepID=A0A9W9FDS4_9EURO|nr:uncharacterized protein N7532_005374 [Penicillium argentinense]KAJ5098373.1 hypothetical protein N7532_005374 [Penicillium argentinense]